ncbi:hypothetical protein IWX47DRAFT_855829 [Phyllosticta citricarpa]
MESEEEEEQEALKQKEEKGGGGFEPSFLLDTHILHICISLLFLPLFIPLSIQPINLNHASFQKKKKKKKVAIPAMAPLVCSICPGYATCL